jgi:hypothetical protein
MPKIQYEEVQKILMNIHKIMGKISQHQMAYTINHLGKIKALEVNLQNYFVHTIENNRI